MPQFIMQLIQESSPSLLLEVDWSEVFIDHLVLRRFCFCIKFQEQTRRTDPSDTFLPLTEDEWTRDAAMSLLKHVDNHSLQNYNKRERASQCRNAKCFPALAWQSLCTLHRCLGVFWECLVDGRLSWWWREQLQLMSLCFWLGAGSLLTAAAISASEMP